MYLFVLVNEVASVWSSSKRGFTCPGEQLMQVCECSRRTTCCVHVLSDARDRNLFSFPQIPRGSSELNSFTLCVSRCGVQPLPAFIQTGGFLTSPSQLTGAQSLPQR